MKKENLWLGYTQADKEQLNDVCERYKNALMKAKQSVSAWRLQ